MLDSCAPAARTFVPSTPAHRGPVPKELRTRHYTMENFLPQNHKKKQFHMPRQKMKSLKEETEIEHLKLLCANFDSSPIKVFAGFPLSKRTIRGLTEASYTKPTEIQKESIGYALNHLDILGAAKTGSGKTLAFLIPVLELLYKLKWSSMDGVGALIITPTRELAYQIFEVLRKIGKYHDFSAGLIIGGKDLKFERNRVDRCNIVVCTPGRLLHHMDDNPLFDCSNLKVLVLDEADRILDLGFQKSMNAIVENLPTERQTLLFSATQTKSVKDLARLSLKDPVFVSVHEHAKHSTPEYLQQNYIVCELHEKLELVWSFVKHHLKQKILVFQSSCKQVKYTYELFCRMRPGVSVMSLYGSMHQTKRMNVYNEFCRKQSAVLFATDIAARGLDFPAVHWVIQFDAPEDGNAYIHRAGRTARYEKDGAALLVLVPSEEESMIRVLQEQKIPVTKIKLNPRKQHSIQGKIEALLARDVLLKESAQRAFVAYLKSVYLMKNKSVFRIDSLNTDAFARSLGLAVTPRIRFLQNAEKIQRKDKAPFEKLEKPQKNLANVSVSTRRTLSTAGTTAKEVSGLLESYSFQLAEGESDEDLLSVTRRILPDDDDSCKHTTGDSAVKDAYLKKPVTKAALAKKILKKNIKPNVHKMFSENYDVEEEADCGINIERAKARIRDQDVVDKKLFQERVKAMRLKQKLKKKESNLKQVQVDDEYYTDESEDGTTSGSHLNAIIEALPDPETYCKPDDSDHDDSLAHHKESLIDNAKLPTNVLKTKRKISKLKSAKRIKRNATDDALHTVISKADQEYFALHLLKPS